MTLPAFRTNGDLIAPYVDQVTTRAHEVARRAWDHPDEAAAACAPFILLTLATARHHLNLPERVLLAQCAVWGGFMAAESYRNWKTQLREGTHG